jgi:hypothetical protein
MATFVAIECWKWVLKISNQVMCVNECWGKRKIYSNISYLRTPSCYVFSLKKRIKDGYLKDEVTWCDKSFLYACGILWQRVARWWSFVSLMFSKRFVQKLWTQEKLKKDVAITLVLLEWDFLFFLSWHIYWFIN